MWIDGGAHVIRAGRIASNASKVLGNTKVI